MRKKFSIGNIQCPLYINCPKSRQPRDSSLMGTSTAQDMSLAQTPQSTWDESLDCIQRDSTGISPEAGDDSGLLDLSLRLRSPASLKFDKRVVSLIYFAV